MDENASAAFNANTNQFVYDTPQQTDLLVEVIDIYFAEAVPKYKWERQGTNYTVKGNGTKIAAVVKKFTQQGRRNISVKEGTLEPLKSGTVVELSWEERIADGVIYNKITKTIIGKKVFLVAKCTGSSGKLSIEINENKLTEAEQVYENPVKFLIGETEHNKVEFAISGKNEYYQEITFRPKSDDSLKKIEENFEKRKNKNAFLFFKAEVKETDDEIKYPNDSEEIHNKDEERTEVRYCNCGRSYDIRCTRYNGKYGPIYKGSTKLEQYEKWQELIDTNKLSIEDKEILIGMSENEGNLDSVQSYDLDLSGEKMILTAGAMQKTVEHTGKGEFTTQVAEFKTENPDKYEELFVSCGWTVEGGALHYQDLSISNSEKITGNALSTEIRKNCNSSVYGSIVECKPLQSIVNAIIDLSFQTKQVLDFIKRLKEQVLPKIPTGYSYALSAYLKSKIGKATALDHHINRPGYVEDDFGASLDNFYKLHPKASKNPAEWGASHATYEQSIVEHYGKNRRGTDMEERYTKMKNNVNLSA